jgi:hypothetical protein
MREPRARFESAGRRSVMSMTRSFFEKREAQGHDVGEKTF